MIAVSIVTWQDFILTRFGRPNGSLRVTHMDTHKDPVLAPKDLPNGVPNRSGLGTPTKKSKKTCKVISSHKLALRVVISKNTYANI